MRLLLCLAEHAGELVSIDSLLDQVWSGVFVTPDSVYQAVASLRRVLGDDPKQPTYIATVPRLGYRMVATVSAWQDHPAAATSDASGPGPRVKSSFPWAGFTGAGLRWAAGAAVCLALVVSFLMNEKLAKNSHSTPAIAPRPQKSIAVLPFLDLTEGMKEEEFADGMTEELIDKLSKIPGCECQLPRHRSISKANKYPSSMLPGLWVSPMFSTGARASPAAGCGWRHG